jgi:hypothetical protein
MLALQYDYNNIITSCIISFSSSAGKAATQRCVHPAAAHLEALSCGGDLVRGQRDVCGVDAKPGILGWQ